MPSALLFVTLLGCQDPTGPGVVLRPSPDATSEPIPEPVDALGEPAESLDVLVVGAGPAGLAALDAAVRAGATARVFERAETVGGNGPYAGRYYGVGTRFQRAAGIEDTVEQALADWEEVTLGGDPSDPRVVRFVERSAEVVEWAVDQLGSPMLYVAPELEFEMPARQHALGGGDKSPTMKLAGLYPDLIVTGREVDGLVVDDGRVIGVTYTDLASGSTGWAQARGGVVVAAGGFGRALDRVMAVHPEVAGVLGHTEIGPTAVGAAVPWVAAGGAAWQAQPGVGFFVHSVADPRDGRQGEVLWMPAAHRMMFVNSDGRRVANEYLATGFRMVDVLLEQDDQRLFGFSARRDTPSLQVPPYNVVDGVTTFKVDAAAELGAIVVADSVAACAQALGVDPAGVEGSVRAYNQISVSGSDDEFDKSARDAPPIPDAPGQVVCAELVVAASKSYTGFAADYDMHLVDGDGASIEGLFGAGEFVGMLGSAGMGGGAAGTITAVLMTGQIAGENAARDAHP
jgi:fumarate reductase flavoprotein subunit